MKISKIIFLSLLLFFILGAVSANDINSTDIANAGDVKEIYVSTTGNDLNTGSSDSPYASIGKAIGDVNASDKATVYLGKGTFSGENDGDFYIDLNHNVYGGHLKFIGVGVNETILDGQSNFRFARIGQNSNITFMNLTFINFKADNGATLYSEGLLTVDNCVFKDSYATGTNGGAIYSHGENTSELYVSNSQFVSCSVNGNPNYNQEYDGGGAICTDRICYVYLKNNTFINTSANRDLKGAAVNIRSANPHSTVRIYTKSYVIGNRFVNISGNEMSFDAGLYVFYDSSYDYAPSINKTFILDNEFVNCHNPSEEYSTVYLKTGKNVFKNNTFINSTNNVGNILLGVQTTLYDLKFELTNDLNNITNYEIINGLELKLIITDDKGNVVKVLDGASASLRSNSNSYSYLIKYSNEMDFMPISFNVVPNPDNYRLGVLFDGDNYYLTNVNVIYDSTPVELWVSPNGFDGNAGTRDSPFETIEHAIDVGFDRSFNVIVHLLEGTYCGEGNVELNLADAGSIQIIGEDANGCIIDGENQHWFLKSDTDVTVKNVKFINGYSNTKDLITTMEYRNGYYVGVGGSLYLENCIIDRCNVVDDYNYYILNGASFDKLTYTNNVGIMRASNIVNSYFENNTNPNVPVGFNVVRSRCGGIIFSDFGCTIVNSNFVNNSAYYGGVVYANSNIISSNSHYVNNHAEEGGVFYVAIDGRLTSQNDTFINNWAKSYGVFGFLTDHEGLDSARPNPSLPNYDIKNDTFIGNSAIKAGVLVMQKGKIRDSYFINNSADYGGAIVIVPYNRLTQITFENLTFTNNSARVNGRDVYLTKDVDHTWYTSLEKIYFDLPLNITFNDLATEYLSDDLTASVYGPCGAIIGGSRVNFKINNENVGYCEIVDSNVKLRYNGFENGEFSLTGDVDNMYKPSTINNALITVNLVNHVSDREVWVSNAGSDVDGDGSKNNPYKTIGHAIDEATCNCLNVIVHIGGGVYAGDLNTCLEVSSALNLTLMGENNTVIDGENNTWFIKVFKGNRKITISDLTIKNMGLDNRQSRVINSISPISIDEGGNLCLNNVVITNNHGGEAIIKNDGNLMILNSIITKNGFSTKALVSGGFVNINNTSMIDNFGVGGSFDCKNIIINNSLIKNSFNLGRYYSLGDGVYSLIEGDCVLENTIILNDGDNSSLRSLGIDEIHPSLVPAFSLENNVFMRNVSMINNYRSPINVKETLQAKYTYLAIMGYNSRGEASRTFTAIGCSFYNFKYLWVLNEWGDYNFTFDKCIFKNITQLSQTRAVGSHSKWVFTNSVFIDVDLYFQRPGYFTTYTPTTISHNNGINDVPYDSNFWASNSIPVIRYADGNQIIFNYSPHNWIVLNNVNGVLKLQLTDGENTVDYNGDLPLSVGYALNNGEMVPVITVDGKSYPVSFDGENIRVDSIPIQNPILAPVVDNTLFTDDLIVTYGDEAKFMARFLYPWGDPLANANVTFTVEGRNYTAITNADGIANIEISLNAGAYSIITVNPASGQTNINSIVVNKLQSVVSAANVNTVYNGGKYLIVTLKDSNGIALAGRDVTVVLNSKPIKGKTDANGQFKVSTNALAPKAYAAAISFAGDANHISSKAAATVKVTKATPKLTAKKATLKNKKYTITLKDNQNKAMKKVKVTLKVKGKTYKATTNKKGKATFKITKLTKRGKYTAKVKFKGNKYFRAVTKSVKLTVK